MEEKNLLFSYYRIRKLIGLLGTLLPILVVAGYGQFLASISHYYYTRSAVFFISTMVSFGLFLIAYRGYPRDKKTEWVSDNLITHIGGVAAIMVIIFPTRCCESGCELIQHMCDNHTYPLWGHDNKLVSTIHLICAGIFLTSMGWMSFFRFTKGEKTKEKRRNNVLYKASGLIMWISILILLTEFIIGQHFTIYDVFILETVSVFAFGISWLVKGEAIKDLFKLFKRQN